MSAPLLRLTGLRKDFGARRILDIPEFALEAGKGYILTGDNGSGKTTFLRVLAGLELATIDTYEFDERTLPLATLRDWIRYQVIYVEQHPYLFNTSIAHNIEYGLKVRGMAKPIRDTLVREAIEWAGVKHVCTVAPKHLSGGEKQRVALARAKILNPKLVLLDEPTANLDQTARAQTIALIQKMCQQNNCVLIACHDHDLIRLPDMRVLSLVNGTIVHSPNPVAKLVAI
jgi:tungstate transport system ATP-binding protein